MNAAESFEVFMGRRYDPSEKALGIDAVVNQDVLYPSHPGFEALAKHLSEKLENTTGNKRALPHKKLETPLGRYARLVEELHVLQGELRAVEEADKRRMGGPGANPVADNNVFKLLTAGSSALQTHLSEMKESVATADGKAAVAAAGADAVAAADASTEATLASLRDDISALRSTQASMLAAAEAMGRGLQALEQRLNRVVAAKSGGGV